MLLCRSSSPCLSWPSYRWWAPSSGSSCCPSSASCCPIGCAAQLLWSAGGVAAQGALQGAAVGLREALEAGGAEAGRRKAQGRGGEEA